MRFIFITICVFLSTPVFGQKKKVLEKIEADLIKEQSQWYDGNIQLWVGEDKIPGLIQFNDKTQVLTFRLDGGEPETLKPSEVKKFDFFDKENRITRNFIAADASFHEIIIQTKHFSLLSNTTSIKAIQSSAMRSYYNPNTGGYGSLGTETRTELGQEMTLFFYDLDEKLYPAIRVTKIETKKSTKEAKDGFWKRFTYDKNPDIDLDEKLLSQMMDIYFPRVKEYMIANKLDRNKFEDLIKIVEYFKQLEDAE
jgi:hypothetical protein